MSKGKIAGYSILGMLLLVGTYVYFWALDAVDAIGFDLTQSVSGSVAAWERSVWTMNIVLAILVVFYGAARGRRDVEPVASLAFLTFTVFSFFVGCSPVTLNFPFNGFATLDVQVTIDPARLMGLFGGGGGGEMTMEPITIGFTLVQLLIVSMSVVCSALLFVKTTLKSRRQPDNPISYVTAAEEHAGRVTDGLAIGVIGLLFLAFVIVNLVMVEPSIVASRPVYHRWLESVAWITGFGGALLAFCGLFHARGRQWASLALNIVAAVAGLALVIYIDFYRPELATPGIFSEPVEFGAFVNTMLLAVVAMAGMSAAGMLVAKARAR